MYNCIFFSLKVFMASPRRNTCPVQACTPIFAVRAYFNRSCKLVYVVGGRPDRWQLAPLSRTEAVEYRLKGYLLQATRYTLSTRQGMPNNLQQLFCYDKHNVYCL